MLLQCSCRYADMCVSKLQIIQYHLKPNFYIEMKQESLASDTMMVLYLPQWQSNTKRRPGMKYTRQDVKVVSQLI